MKIKYFFLVISLIFSYKSMSQDIHFSQITRNSIFTNPAYTGKFTGDWRAGNNYRTQGSNFGEPYHSTLLSFDRHFYIYSQEISGGVQFVNDFSADNSLMINKLCFSEGYKLQASEHSFLHFGIYAGLIYKRSAFDAYTLPEQFDMSTGGFNQNMPTNESFSTLKTVYLDLGSGILWNYQASFFEAELGGAIFQINKPRENTDHFVINVPRKYLLQAGINFTPSKIFSINPQAFYSWINHASELLVGANFTYYLANKPVSNAIFASTFVRTGINRNIDALIVSAGILYRNWAVGLSYDFDIAPVRVSIGKSTAFEISLIYTRPSTLATKITKPCDRF